MKEKFSKNLTFLPGVALTLKSMTQAGTKICAIRKLIFSVSY